MIPDFTTYASASTKFLQSDWVTLWAQIAKVEQAIWILKGERE